MRPKSKKIIITFHTTTAAMGMESACAKAGQPGRLIPVPKAITASCGMAWSAPVETRASLEEFVKEQSITVDGWYELLL